jgi:hypothetical protein
METLNFIIAMLFVIGLILTLVGLPIGLVLLVLYFVRPKNKRTGKQLKFVLRFFYGIPILIISFAISLVLQMLGLGS